ncbi:UBP-type zinc finger domain-containing protein [Intrasporangium sp. DVR]|uniref:UBP-type zinc finger domain-containing protein n=1 Tax=Intrasporangium sp. DVR TaxID=3127867 RepID=UPI00313A6CBE
MVDAPGSAPEIDPAAPPSGTGCAECLAADGWWVHLRRCAACGHIGCCDTSPSQHATAHFRATGHPVVRSFEPGESWFYDYRIEDVVTGPELAPPASHPVEQGVPAPRDRVPDNWPDLTH